MENRHGLVVETWTVPAPGTAERDAALQVVAHLGPGRGTVGGDKGYNQRLFVEGARTAGKTPHVAVKVRGNAIDGRTTRHPGYRVSQRLRHRGVPRVAWIFTFTAAAYNLVRLRRLVTP